MPHFAAMHFQLIAMGVVAFVAVAMLRRVPILGRIIDIAFTLTLLSGIVVLLGQRERFDPYIAKLMGALDLDSQTVAGRETRIPMSADGHFWARATIDGVERRMLIDSGATITALSSRTAAATGLSVRSEVFPIGSRPQTAQSRRKPPRSAISRSATSPRATCPSSYRQHSDAPTSSA